MGIRSFLIKFDSIDSIEKFFLWRKYLGYLVSEHYDDEWETSNYVEILNKVSWFIQVSYKIEKTYTIKYESYDRSNNNLIEEKQIIVDKKYIEEQLSLNGYLTLQ